MFYIRKRFSFSASHQLAGLPKDHPCSRLHGHNYTVEVTLRSSTLDRVGFVRDYRELENFKRWLDTNFDHQHLNDQMSDNPTAENMAALFYDRCRQMYPEVHCVSVSETDKTWADYTSE